MYEYANRMSEKGHQVQVLHLRNRFQRYSKLTYPFALFFKNLENSFSPFWFKFHKSSQVRYVRSVTDRDMPDADVIIYTWWELGEKVANLSPSKGIKVNLIQDYEIWMGSIEKVHQSYDLKGVHNIVISTGLQKKVAEFTEKESLILFNAIDTSRFKLETPIEERNPYTICMMYHIQERKGTKFGMEALQIIKQQVPELQAILFGVFDKPDNLPSWIEYHQKPDNLCQLYNRSSIYMTNSLQEGWALPPAEAMHCGCALVCTDIPGHQDYANENTALLVQPGESLQMVKAVISLINNPKLRIQLAKEGHKFIQRFSWNKSVSILENYLSELKK